MTFLDFHADQMAVKDKDVLLSAGGIELSVKANDNRIPVEIIVGAEQPGIVRPGVDHLSGGGGEYRRADRIPNVDTMMDSVAAAAGAAELVAWAVELIEAPWKWRFEPEVFPTDEAWRFEGRPKAARAAGSTGAKAGIGSLPRLESRGKFALY